MSPPINIDGTQVNGITIDGTNVSEVTVDGDVVFSVSAIPDTSMFSSPIYQWTVTEGLSVSDGQTADNWTEQLAGIGDATAVDTPTYRSDTSGRASVDYDGTNDAHNFSPDNALPTGSEPVSLAATVYLRSDHPGTILSYGDGSDGLELKFGVRSGGTFFNSFGNVIDIRAGDHPLDQWITLGYSTDNSDSAEAYINGSSVGTDTPGSMNLQDTNHGIGYRRNNATAYLDGYIYDVVLCDAEESDQAFTDYSNNRI